MPLRAIESQRLYQQIAAQIAGMIRNGEWSPGSRLPPERDIARLLGVSRPTVREAMLALELGGLVEVRSGAGTYVRGWATPANNNGNQNGDIGPSAFDTLAARRAIEGEVAAIAAGHVSEEAAAGIEASIVQLEREWTLGIHNCFDENNGDFLFHVRLAAATENQVLEGIVRNLWDNMRTPLFKTISERMNLPNSAKTSCSEHHAILERVMAGDAAGARAAMHQHLDQVQIYLLRDD